MTNTQQLIEQAESFAAPEHLVALYNSSQIDYEQMAILSAKQYLEDANKSNKQLEIVTSQLENKTLEVLSLRSASQDITNLNLKLAFKENELVELQSKIIELQPFENICSNLSSENQSLKSELEKYKSLSGDARQSLRKQYELQALLSDSNDKVSELTKHIARQDNVISTWEGRFNDLKNELNNANNKAKKAISDIATANALLKEERSLVAELRQNIKDGTKSVEEAKEAITTVSKAIETLSNGQKKLDKENRLLSLYINAHSTAPMMETPEGHQLRVLMLDQNEITSDNGKDALEEGTALFHWCNPNGYSCLVALSSETLGEDNLLLMPSLADKRIIDATNEDEMRIAARLTDHVSPDKKYHKEIAAHIKSFDAKEFKRSMLKAFSRATYLTNQTEHLMLEAENGIGQGELLAMKELIGSSGRGVHAVRERSRSLLRPKSKSSSKKKKRS